LGADDFSQVKILNINSDFYKPDSFLESRGDKHYWNPEITGSMNGAQGIGTEEVLPDEQSGAPGMAAKPVRA
jgi:hypothetical protein